MSSGSDAASEEKLWLGFIEPRSSWSSVLALSLSLIAGIYQLYWFAVGPQVRFIPPQQVMFNIVSAEDVRIILPLTFKNNAPSRYSDVVTEVEATFRARLSDGTFEVPYKWEHAVRSNPLAKNPEEGLLVDNRATPIMVKGSSAISQDTAFAFTASPVCLEGTCGELLNPNGGLHSFFWHHLITASEESTEFVIEVLARTASGDVIDAACRVEIDSSFTDTLKGDQKYHAPPCDPAYLGPDP